MERKGHSDRGSEENRRERERGVSLKGLLIFQVRWGKKSSLSSPRVAPLLGVPSRLPGELRERARKRRAVEKEGRAREHRRGKKKLSLSLSLEVIEFE